MKTLLLVELTLSLMACLFVLGGLMLSIERNCKRWRSGR